MIADLLFTFGAVLMALAPSVWVLMLARLIVGMGVGVAAQIVPLFLSEVADIEIRGQVVAINTVMITVGQLVSVGLSFAL